MNQQMFLSFLMFFLALLYALCWPHPGPAQSRAAAKIRTRLHRLRHRPAAHTIALAEGLDPSAAERVFGYRQATITTWLSRAGEHARTLHKHCEWCSCSHKSEVAS